MGAATLKPLRSVTRRNIVRVAESSVVYEVMTPKLLAPLFKPLAHSVNPPSEGAPWWDGAYWDIWSHHGEASKGVLLAKVFSRARIGERLWPSVVVRYADRFPRSMMVNESLGTGLGDLVGHLASRGRYEVLTWMAVRAPQADAAHQILVCGVDDEAVLDAISANWILGPEDQLRLVLALDPNGALAAKVLGALGEEGTELAKSTLELRRSGRVPRAGAAALEDYDKAGALGEGTQRWVEPEKVRGPRHFTEGTHNSKKVKNLQFEVDEELSARLERGLGVGESLVSLRAWALFFSLADNSRDVSVEDIVRSARALAYSELRV